MKKFTSPLILLIFGLLFQTTNLLAQSDGCGDLDFTLKANGVYCGSQRGEIEIDIQGGSGQYLVEWDNHDQSIWNKTNIFFPFYTIEGLLPSDYSIKVMDIKTKCAIRKKINLPDNATPEGLELTPISVGCNGMGILAVRIPTRNPPFNIKLKGPITADYLANSNDFRIYNLPPGDYEVGFVVGECIATATTTIGNEGGLSELSIVPILTDCNTSNGAVLATIQGGQGDYRLSWEGPSSGKLNLDGSAEIPDFVTGSYKFTIEDANGCISSQNIDIDMSGMSLALSATQAKCNQNGTINLDITAGSAPFSITWRGGGIEGSQTIDGTSTSLSVPAGSYVVEIKDANGCSTSENTAVILEPTDLYCSITPTNTTCNLNNGAINVFISGGKKPYTLSYTGPVSGSATVDGTTEFSNLPAGTYTTFLQDADGCAVSESSVINIGPTETANSSFSYSAAGTSVNFFNNSTAGSYEWSFGDGTTSDSASPSKDYSSAGAYEVCLTTAGNCDASTQCQILQITALKDISGQNLQPTDIDTKVGLGLGMSSEESLRVAQNYPNPFVNKTDILFELPVALLTTITIHDRTGKVIHQHTANYEKGSNLFTFNQNSIASGIYYYTIKAGPFLDTKKMLVK